MKKSQVDKRYTITSYRHCIVMAASETKASSMILLHHGRCNHIIPTNPENFFEIKKSYQLFAFPGQPSAVRAGFPGRP